MTDQELHQAIGQVVENAVESKLNPVQQDIHELKEQVGRLEKRMDRLESKVDQLESRIDGLGTRVVSLETQVTGLRVYMDTELDQRLKLLLEGQQALWDRFVPYEEFDPLEDRTEVLELTVKRHSQEIRELQPPA